MSSEHFDVVVIGSGFGGSVSALRLVETGYSVAVLEAGRRFADDEFAKTSWHVRDYLFAPAAGCYGIFRITPLRQALVLTGAGVGGGSLGYANTLYQPKDEVFANSPVSAAELAAYYEQARRMLGVATYPRTSPADRVIREVATDMGLAQTYRRAYVGVYFGPPSADPYFGGVGPARSGCTDCGECMTGCRHNAKNTLVKNYLYLAERAGADVRPLTTVTQVRRRPGGYAVETVPTGARGRRRRDGAVCFTADQVIFAAGALGTARLLHAMKADGVLPHLSDRVGHLTRTNSEAVLAARSRRRDVDFTRGVAITSSFHPDEHTHVEPVRYGRGSNLLALMGAVLVDGTVGDSRTPRWLAGLRQAWRSRRELPHLHNPKRWSEQTIVVLVMQTLDNSITTALRRRWYGRRVLTSRQGDGAPNPTWIPAGHEVARRVADKIDGVAGGSVGDLANMPVTGHLIGGATIGTSPESGVVDPYHRVFGHEGLHVVDGAAVSVNLGVNPSLTITAQAERALVLWPPRGELDPRPALGVEYVRIAPVAPKNPVVPEAAPGALRLTVVS